jgi:membrane protease YdiL (CAAX protease family)
MSISVLPAAAAFNFTAVLSAILLAVSLVTLMAAWFVGLSRAGGAGRPPRIPPDRSAWPLAAVFFGGAGCYLFAGTAVTSLWLHYHPGVKPQDILNYDSGAALLSTIPPLVALAAILIGDSAVYEVVRQNLGLGRRRLPAGVTIGLIGALIVVPPLFLLSGLIEIIYQHVHFRHPTEHPLLKVLGERPNALVEAAIVIGACVIAPLWEEILFRGQLQTLLKRAIDWTSRSRSSARFAQWSAILLTSGLFMMLHPVWSWPVIFVLAVCLGYAYERTGNLWACIALHAAFNSVNTAIYLLGSGSH